MWDSNTAASDGRPSIAFPLLSAHYCVRTNCFLQPFSVVDGVEKDAY
jgi:hypothetical protein